MKGCHGEQFYCSVCCHATGFVWTLCICTKNEIAAKLVSTLRYETKRNMLLTINKDGGREFQGALNDFLQEEGVESRIIPRYDHSGNGRIESVNRAISDAARTMLIDSMHPLAYWSYAVRYAALISNHVLLHRKEEVPAVLMGKCKIKFRKFLRFGGQVLFHLPKELQRGKFEPHAIPGIFMGLTDDGFSYLIYSLNDDRVIPTRAVKSLNSPVAGNADIFMDAQEGLSFEDYLEHSSADDVEDFADNLVDRFQQAGGKCNTHL